MKNIKINKEKFKEELLNLISEVKKNYYFDSFNGLQIQRKLFLLFNMKVDKPYRNWYFDAFTEEERKKIDGKLYYAIYRVKHNLSNSEIKNLLRILKYFDVNNHSSILNDPYYEQFIEKE